MLFCVRCNVSRCIWWWYGWDKMCGAVLMDLVMAPYGLGTVWYDLTLVRATTCWIVEDKSVDQERKLEWFHIGYITLMYNYLKLVKKSLWKEHIFVMYIPICIYLYAKHTIFLFHEKNMYIPICQTHNRTYTFFDQIKGERACFRHVRQFVLKYVWH
jgi:hypothetical protein